MRDSHKQLKSSRYKQPSLIFSFYFNVQRHTQRLNEMWSKELTLSEIRVLHAVAKGSKTVYAIHKYEKMGIGQVSDQMRRLRKRRLLQRTKITKTRRISWEHELTSFGSTELERTRKLLLQIISPRD